MFGQKAQIALENVSSYQNRMYKRYQENPNLAMKKKKKNSSVFIPGAQIALLNFS